MEQLRLEVDPDVCMGMGYCVRTAPALFGLDGDGVVTLVWGSTAVGPVAVPADLREAAMKASELCPSGAVIITGVVA